MRELHDEIPPELLRDFDAAPLVPEQEIEVYAAARGRGRLTESELHALWLLSHGLTIEMGAELLDKSVDTIKNQTKTARFKLRAKNTTHAIALALRAGLIE